MVAQRDRADGRRRVDEDGVGSEVRAEVERAAGARRLDDVAVEPAGRVGRGDDAACGHGAAGPRADVGRALQLGDRDVGLADRVGDGHRVGGRRAASPGVLRA